MQIGEKKTKEILGARRVNKNNEFDDRIFKFLIGIAGLSSFIISVVLVAASFVGLIALVKLVFGC